MREYFQHRRLTHPQLQVLMTAEDVLAASACAMTVPQLHRKLKDRIADLPQLAEFSRIVSAGLYFGSMDWMKIAPRDATVSGGVLHQGQEGEELWVRSAGLRGWLSCFGPTQDQSIVWTANHWEPWHLYAAVGRWFGRLQLDRTIRVLYVADRYPVSRKVFEGVRDQLRRMLDVRLARTAINQYCGYEIWRPEGVQRFTPALRNRISKEMKRARGRVESLTEFDFVGLTQQQARRWGTRWLEDLMPEQLIRLLSVGGRRCHA